MGSSIYSLSTYTTAQTSTRKGIAGLASGIDTDSMIEAMTAATRSKIAKLQQKQTSTGWKAEAYQSITSALLSFKNKYMSSLSATNMRNASFFQNAVITAAGKNASAISIRGAASQTLSNFSVRSIDKLATSASATSSVSASQGAIKSADISSYLTNGLDTSSIEGGTINLKFDGINYDIKIKNVEIDKGDAAANAQNIIDALNRGIKDAGLEGKVAAVIGTAVVGGVTKSTGQVELRVSGSGSVAEINGLSNNVKDVLGIAAGETARFGDPIRGIWDIIGDPGSVDATIKHQDFADALDGQTVTFSLNGVNRTIKFDEAEFAAYNDFADVDDVARYLSDKLQGAFGDVDGSPGTAKVTVIQDGTTGSLLFKTVDSTSILSVASGSASLIGYDGAKGMLGINFADASRALTTEPLAKANLNNDVVNLMQTSGFENNGSMDIMINGTKFSVFKDKILVYPALGGLQTHEFKSGTSLRDITNTINNSDIGAKVQYNSTTDNFSIIATESGTLGKLNVSGDLASALFGSGVANGTNIMGTDASMKVSFDGVTETTITRNSNSFTLNGMSITLNSTFAASSTPGDRSEDVTFTAKANTDEIVNAIKEMITAYNEIIANVNSQLTTKQNRNYQPLTADQKKDFTKDEIETWENEAKKGLLFGDSLLRSLTTDLRFAFSLPVGSAALNQIGIATASWEDNGKLTIDETKLRQMIESDPEKVSDIFTRSAASGTVNASSTNSGIMARLDSVMEKYTSSTRTTSGLYKGLLIGRSGHESVPLSLINNTLYKEMDSYAKQIQSLQTRLYSEEQRFAKQFSSLESYISKMNQQSSWLNQFQTTT